MSNKTKATTKLTTAAGDLAKQAQELQAQALKLGPGPGHLAAQKFKAAAAILEREITTATPPTNKGT